MVGTKKLKPVAPFHFTKRYLQLESNMDMIVKNNKQIATI